MAVESRAVTGFHAVELRGFGTIYIEMADEHSLVIEADDSLIRSIISEVVDGRLVIRFDPWKAFMSWASSGSVRMWVKAPAFTGVSIAGSGTVQSPEIAADALEIGISGAGRIHSGVRARALSVNVSGSGDVTLVGYAETQTVRITGTGTYSALGLASREAQITISGAGRADVSVEESLDVQIGGAANVTYVGNPSVTQRIGGLGKVERAATP